MTRRPKIAPAGQGSLFTSLFEEDFFLRTLGDVVRIPDVALGELVANAWDAGAAQVAIAIPEMSGEELSVEDDGCGLTTAEFLTRWMTLAYNRQKHQGANVKFPAERSSLHRRAYGRNGQGRHGLLCFGNAYRVETWRDGSGSAFDVHVSSGKEPFESRPAGDFKRTGHGTRLSVRVERGLPDPDRIREVLSSRFLHDPSFSITVNGTSLPLTDLPGFAEHMTLSIPGEAGLIIRLELDAVQGDAGRTKHQSGVAFWVGGRLVGEPGWTVAGTPLLDGRTRAGRRLTIVVKTNDLHAEVLPDWTGFRKSELMRAVTDAVIEAVGVILKRIYSERIEEATGEALNGHATELLALEPGEQNEVAEVAESIARANPLLSPEVLSTAVAGMIESKRKAAPDALIQRIMALADEDIEGLHRLLDEWTVRDARTVLDEVGRRIKVVEALEKLMGDPSVDELHVLHPLVTQARWLFGPEYDSPHYASNVGLRNAVLKVFGTDSAPDMFENSRKRPDLLVRPDSTLAAVATEDFDPETNIVTFRRILLIELKKGGFTIGRKEMNQAHEYVEELLGSGLIDGRPFIHAFVVGHKLDPKATLMRRIGEGESGRVEAVTFGQMVRMANARLFQIRSRVQDRHPESGSDLLKRLLQDPVQMDLLGLMQKRVFHSVGAKAISSEPQELNAPAAMLVSGASVEVPQTAGAPDGAPNLAPPDR